MQHVIKNNRKSKNLLEKLNNFQPVNSDVTPLRILLHGPVGAGKSSFINSVDSCLEGRVTTRALTSSILEGGSFTLECKTFKFKKTDSFYPFTLIDICGLEDKKGIQTQDIIKLLNGHIRNYYTFNSVKAISEEDPKYNKNPSLKDKIHCLVSVLSANSISRMEEKKDVIRKMKEVRRIASNLGIPQAIIMTKVDEACPLVKANLEKVYTSKKIKEKMELCSSTLGVPVSYIFPIKNYHEEHTTNNTADFLILDALQRIVNFADDYVKDQVDND
ncbi:interferon-induced protein 44-like [Misgurnus anguillicaudatus]|uniref:interferon-induced protein 44-like n=1 Tax=Misgurnus anguillicaudatus TaxID=75329 RepID=UPI003CCF1878